MNRFELARTVPILEVAEAYSNILVTKRKGSSAWCLCPFHSEKTASMRIDASKGLFYCFGCHAGGTVIDWVSRARGVQPFEAADMICKDHGLTPDRSEEFLSRHKTRDGSTIGTDGSSFSRQLQSCGAETQAAINRLDTAAVSYLKALDRFIADNAQYFGDDTEQGEVIAAAISEREKIQNLCDLLMNGTLDDQISLLCRYADYIPYWEQTTSHDTTEDIS